MDVGSENLFRNESDARNSELSSKTKVGQKGKTFYFERCLTTSKAQIVLQELHGVVGRHFVTNITTKKILDAGYWWPTLFKNTHDFCKCYDNCHKIGGLKIKSFAKLVTTLLKEPS